MPSPEDVRAPSPESNGRASTEAVEEGVFGNLPRTRPQRATQRRIASRGPSRPAGRAGKRTTGGAAKGPEGTAKGPGGAAAKAAPGKAAKAAGGAEAKAAPRAASPRKPRKAKPRPRAAPKRVPPQPADSAPRQGFESEPTRTATGPVQPPGGAELLTSALEIVGEVTRAGASAGERVLRDLFSRLPH